MTASCHLLPQGSYILLPTVITTLGWICSLLQDDCDYIILRGPLVEVLTTDSPPYIEMGIQAYREPEFVNGEWTTDFVGDCRRYPIELNHDPFWKSSKSFSFISLVLGGGATFFLWFSTCCTFSKATWRWTGYEVSLACIFQALAFLFFKTDVCTENTCELFWGSKLDIAATVLWFVASICIFSHYPAPKETDDSQDGLVVAEDQPQSSSASSPSPAQSEPGSDDKDLVDVPMQSGESSGQGESNEIV